MSENVTGVASGMLVARGRVSAPLAIGACVIGGLMANVWLYLRRRRIGRRRIRGGSETLADRRFVAHIRGPDHAVPPRGYGGQLASFPFHASCFVASLSAGRHHGGAGPGPAEDRRGGRHREGTPVAHLDVATFDTVGVLATLDLLSAGGRVHRLPDGEAPECHDLHGRQSRHPGRRCPGRIEVQDILQGLAGASDYVARSCLIDGDLSAEAKTITARRFMEAQRLTFPIVVKPIQGNADQVS